MKKRVPRAYADTSVFGGVFDEEFREASQEFFGQVRRGRFRLVTSAIVGREAAEAPTQVRQFYEGVLLAAEVADVTEEAVDLQQAYLGAGIVSPKWGADALHVALATTSGCSLIVSWNFAHIVHFDKIPLYNEVNAAEGYGAIAIHSPLEVIGYEDEDS
jgi:predicted nucleic acid-binding protein